MNEIQGLCPNLECGDLSPLWSQRPLGSLDVLVEDNACDDSADEIGLEVLSSLPVGSRLVLRSRKDWRTATVASISDDRITLTVASPTGYTYRMYRPHDAAIVFDGSIPLLGEGSWRVGLARYDVRW